MENKELVVFEIKTEYFRRFQDEFAKLVNKAAKLKVLVPTFQVVGEKVVPAVIGESGEVKSPAKFLTIVKVSGQSPKLAGWTFAAVLQHEELGNIVRRVPGSEDVKLALDLRTCPPYCDHCETKRRRNDTYVVVHEDGRQVQVGRNCLKDFTGHDSPEAIARWAEVLGCFVDTVSDGEEGFGGGGGEAHWSLVEFLGVVCAAIACYGWLSRTKAREFGKNATADYALSYLNCRNDGERRKVLPDGIVTKDLDRAKSALDYALAHFEETEGQDLEEYVHNLRLVCQGGSVNGRSSGLAASLVQFSERLQGREIERQRAAESKFQGTVGKREVFTLTVTRVIDIDSELYGVSHLHLMQDAAGNRFSWKTSSECLQVGTTYACKGTVKEHKVYVPRGAEAGFEGIEQTVLNRCVCLKVEAVS